MDSGISRVKNKPKWSAKRIALLALLSTLSYVGRIAFSFIPNVQPMSVLLLLISVHLGMIDGLIVSCLSIILSNLFLGFGPWTFYQIIAYSVVLLTLTPILKKIGQKLWIGSLLAGLMGIMYGFIISILFVWSYQINHFWAYYLRGIPFDVAHSIGNIGFYIILQPIIIKILKHRKLY